MNCFRVSRLILTEDRIRASIPHTISRNSDTTLIVNLAFLYQLSKTDTSPNWCKLAGFRAVFAVFIRSAIHRPPVGS